MLTQSHGRPASLLNSSGAFLPLRSDLRRTDPTQTTKWNQAWYLLMDVRQRRMFFHVFPDFAILALYIPESGLN